MKKYAYQWVQDWCQENGWTELFIERYHYWAFPPDAVMPEPIPVRVLQQLKREHGLSPIERWIYVATAIATVTASLSTFWMQSPLPIVAAFAVCAFAVAYLDDEE